MNELFIINETSEEGKMVKISHEFNNYKDEGYEEREREGEEMRAERCFRSKEHFEAKIDFPEKKNKTVFTSDARKSFSTKKAERKRDEIGENGRWWCFGSQTTVAVVAFAVERGTKAVFRFGLQIFII